MIADVSQTPLDKKTVFTYILNRLASIRQDGDSVNQNSGLFYAGLDPTKKDRYPYEITYTDPPFGG